MNSNSTNSLNWIESWSCFQKSLLFSSWSSKRRTLFSQVGLLLHLHSTIASHCAFKRIILKSVQFSWISKPSKADSHRTSLSSSLSSSKFSLLKSRVAILLTFFPHYTKNFHLNYFMTEEKPIALFQICWIKRRVMPVVNLMLHFKYCFRNSSGKRKQWFYIIIVQNHISELHQPLTICSLLLKSIASKKKKSFVGLFFAQ